MKLKEIYIFFLNLIRNFKKELSPSKPLLYSTQLPILRIWFNDNASNYFLASCWHVFEHQVPLING